MQAQPRMIHPTSMIMNRRANNGRTTKVNSRTTDPDCRDFRFADTLLIGIIAIGRNVGKL
jgi:hypothetical protein